jgi:hypothetical protein
MRLDPLYRVRFTYPEEWGVELAGRDGRESQFFFFANGSCEGRVSGRMRGSNHPRRRVDGTFLPDFQGVIETTDGATIVFDMRGYGRAYPAGARQIVATVTHMSDDERYRWLNDTVSVGTGEVRSGHRQATELVVDVVELVWDGVAP